MQVFPETDYPQGSEQWHALRAGIPTASRFADILTQPKKKGEESKTRRTYLLTLAGERYTGHLADSFTSFHTERGKELEPDARATYAFMKNVEPEQIGFVKTDDGDAGCSPDSLIGPDGLLEIKTALPAILIDRILTGEPPPEHKAQVQGQLWITEREWCDLAIYWPGLPLFVVRANRDETFIATLAEAVGRFVEELDAVVERVRAYSGNPREDARQAFRDSVAMHDASGRQMSVVEAG